MYGFADTNAHTLTNSLPSEAVFINGVSLDNTLEGFRTMYVEGRESLENELNELTVEGIDGSALQSHRTISRTLTIAFKVFGDDSTQFEERYRKIAKALNCGMAKWSFNDEPNLYYNGILKKIEAPEAHATSQMITTEIYCPDPYKYSSTLKSFTASNGVLTIENDGFPAEIEYEITHSSENGFIAIASDQGAMEFGNRKEADKAEFTESPEVVNQSDFFTSTTNDSTDQLNGYPLPGKVAEYSLKSDRPCGNSDGPFDWLEMSEAGTGTGWHGGGKTITIPEAKRSKNFDCYFFHWFQKAFASELGEQTICWLTADNKLILAIDLYADVKNSLGGVITWSEGPNKNRFRREDFHAGGYAGGNAFGDGCAGHDMIRKEGEKVTTFYWGSYREHIIPEIKDMVCAKVQICIKKHGTDSQMTRNYIRAFSMSTLGVKGMKDVKNRYPDDSVVRIKDGKFYLNGMEKPEEEILGSTYFKAGSGETKVNVAVSDWATAPTVKAYIRERWL